MATAEDEESAISAAMGGAGKSAYVRRIFSEIAPRYDFLNHLLSLNIDRSWRGKAIRDLRFERKPRGRYLDLCAGTLDVSVALATSSGFRGSIVGADFAEPMLKAGGRKIRGMPIAPVTADALNLPFESSSMSGAIVAFGVRNIADLDAGLREVYRVIERGGYLVILEFSTPRSSLVNAGYQVYFNRILPVVGGLVSGHGTAYRYLPRSVASFPVEEELADRMTGAGFVNVRWRSLSLGIAAIHTGQRR